MKNLVRFAAVFLVFSFTLSGCYYDKESELYPTPPNCDTTGVISYSQAIAPIMVANCNVCHSTAVASGGIITDNYNGLSIIAKNGLLLSSVNWTGTPMPKGAQDTISLCDRTKIKKWVDAGSLNN
jgi:hypothetical protein